MGCHHSKRIKMTSEECREQLRNEWRIAQRAPMPFTELNVHTKAYKSPYRHKQAVVHWGRTVSDGSTASGRSRAFHATAVLLPEEKLLFRTLLVRSSSYIIATRDFFAKDTPRKQVSEMDNATDIVVNDSIAEDIPETGEQPQEISSPTRSAEETDEINEAAEAVDQMSSMLDAKLFTTRRTSINSNHSVELPPNPSSKITTNRRRSSAVQMLCPTPIWDVELILAHPMAGFVKFIKSHRFRLLDLFRAMDRDVDGKVTYEDIWVALSELNIPLPDHSVEDLIDIIDENGDGLITFSEFKHAVEDHKLHERYHRSQRDSWLSHPLRKYSITTGRRKHRLKAAKVAV
eukprot:m.32957 g.32957  ORF g.32957 m.32957 type:complete len:346 (-) comp14179_c0_seq2:165-1202(-)